MNPFSEKIVTILSSHISPILIIGFGSFWNGTSRIDSDVDIAVYSAEYITPVERFNMAQEISDVIDRDVDLIDLNQTNTIFKEHIIRTSTYLWEKSLNDRALFESKVLLEAIHFKEERKEIIERLKEEGTLF